VQSFLIRASCPSLGAMTYYRTIIQHNVSDHWIQYCGYAVFRQSNIAADLGHRQRCRWCMSPEVGSAMTHLMAGGLKGHREWEGVCCMNSGMIDLIFPRISTIGKAVFEIPSTNRLRWVRAGLQQAVTHGAAELGKTGAGEWFIGVGMGCG
jgi:hypothetical protein